MTSPTTDNPFRSSRLRPGAAPYVSPGPEWVAGLADQFATAARAQIIGPHGSGKSALLAALVGALRARGRTVEVCELRAGQRRLPENIWRWPTVPPVVLAIDGFEQLSKIEQWRVRYRTWRAGVGLLVSAHAPVGLPTLVHTSPNLAVAQQVAAQLQSGGTPLVSPDDVAHAYSRCGGDLRETLFALYDLYEARRTTD